MEYLFKIFSDNPDYFIWVFGVVNFLWIVFLYFNTKRHQKELINIKKSVDLDLERRKKVFEMKARQYEDYFKNIDAIHNKHRSDYQEILSPIMNEYLSSILLASSRGDEHAITNCVIRLNERLSAITYDGMQEMMVLESETNNIRLTASDEVAKILDEIKKIYSDLFEMSSKMISDLMEIVVNNNQDLANENQKNLDIVGRLAKEKSAELREQMRKDLKEI